MKVSIQRVIVVALLLASIGTHGVNPRRCAATATHGAATRARSAHACSAYYYLWWSKLHWHDRLAQLPVREHRCRCQQRLGISGSSGIQRGSPGTS